MNSASSLKIAGITKLPTTSYVISATARNGSNLLCDALTHTNVLGKPGEFFLRWYREVQQPKRFKAEQQRQQKPGDAEHLRTVIDHAATPNGVLGMKVMWNQLDIMVNKLQPFSGFRKHPAAIFSTIFPNLHYIFLKREDKVRQAVSMTKAIQSGKWIAVQPGIHQEKSGGKRITHLKPVEKKPSEKALCYDFHQIASFYHTFIKKDTAWENYFTQAEIKPCRVFYHQLEHSLDEVLFNIANYLNIPLAETSISQKPALKKQSDSINEEWAQRFKEELAHRTRTPFHKLWLQGSNACISKYHQYLKPKHSLSSE